MHRRSVCLLAALAGVGSAQAAEVTVKNDSLTDFGSAAIVWGFAARERAASWLTSPCNGNLRAVQIFWRSPPGNTGQSIQWQIDVHRAGTFPTPGAIALMTSNQPASILGPVLTDGVLNEWRFLDENSAVPLNVAVGLNETFVVSFTFDTAPTPFSGPSVVRDVDGPQPNRNAIYTSSGTWFSAPALGVNGDWVIRAVVDCPAAPLEADVAIGMDTSPELYTAGQPLSYTIVVSNAGPAAANGATVADLFPAAYTSPTWTCSGSAGGTCPASGNGNITHPVNLPAGSQVVYSVTGTVAPGTTGVLTNSAVVVAPTGVTDPLAANNTATVNTAPESDRIFADDFES